MSEEIIDLMPIVRLNKDMTKAMMREHPGGITANEARYLVDTYYTIQKARIRSSNQVSALERDAEKTGNEAEPHTAIDRFVSDFSTQEDNIKRVLSWYAESHPMSWFFDATLGIGGVLAAGLLAHIDITRCPTVGHIWRFAGLDPTVTWEPKTVRPWNASLKNICVHPSALITTRRGYIPIKDVVIGDEVLTHHGRWRKVLQTFENYHNGQMYSTPLSGCAGSAPWLTGSHPVYVQQRRSIQWSDGGQKRFKGADFKPRWNALSKPVVDAMKSEREAGDTLAIIAERHECSASAVSLIVRNLSNIQPHTNPIGWARADSIQPGWMLFVPTVPDDGIVPTLRFSGIGRDGMVAAVGRYPHAAHPRANWIPAEMPLTNELSRVLGLYVAEGHVSQRCAVTFSFHSDETDYHAAVTDTFKHLFGLDSSVRINESNHSAQVSVFCQPLADQIINLFGAGAHNKCPPVSWLGMRKDLLASFVRGAFEGDGVIDPQHVNLTTVSLSLSRWLADALRRLHIGCSVSVWSGLQRSPSGSVNHVRAYKVTVNAISDFFSVVMGEDGVVDSTRPVKWSATGAWYAARETRKMPYSGPVYNLEVEDDHSYIADGLAVHNCWKISDSFVKLSGRADSFYSKVYKDRKALEWKNNLAGALTQQANESMAKKKYGKSTDQYAWYMGLIDPAKVAAKLEDGASITAASCKGEGGFPMLSPGHIDSRARRYAVKLFLSHLHACWYEQEFQKPPPNPFAIAILGHAHFIEPPQLAGRKTLHST